MKSLLRIMLIVALTAIPVLTGFAQDAAAPAAEAAPPAPTLDTGNTAWLLTSTALVLLMTVPGLALFYGGIVRRKNILSTMYYSLGAAVVVSVLWVIVQYSLAFGTSNGWFGNFDKVFLNGVLFASGSDVYNAPLWGAYGIPESVFSMFQLMFAIITVALISGSIVERMSFKAWILFVIFWSLLVYAPLANWVWGGGWLGTQLGPMFGLPPNTGALDFAGGLVVHISSGVSALVAAIYLGPRVRYGKDPIIPNNTVYTLIGAGLLWVGWFGFNAGSALMANGQAASAFVVTNTAAAMAAFTWMVIEWFHHGKPSLVGAVTGVVAGLVAITPASGFVDVGAALIIGIVVSLVCYIFVAFVKKALGYDDSLDAFGVHAIGGIVGAICTGLFANPAIGFYFSGIDQSKGLFFGNPSQVVIQLISVGAAILLAVVGTLVSLFIISLITKLRVEPQEEVNGLDLTQHGEKLADR